MGTSLLTNQSAMTALQTLRGIGDSMDQTQRRVSTGLRINEASENTAYWSISSMMKHDRGALSAVSDAMNLGKNQIDIASTATDATKKYLDDIQKTVTQTYGKGAGDIQKIQDNVKANMENISSAVISSSLAEKNILASDGGEVSIAGGYRREGGAVYVDMIKVGGANLNFGKMDAAGQIDMSEGVLKGVFGTGGDGLTAKTKALTDAQAALDTAKGERATKIDEYVDTTLAALDDGATPPVKTFSKNELADIKNAMTKWAADPANVEKTFDNAALGDIADALNFTTAQKTALTGAAPTDVNTAQTGVKTKVGDVATATTAFTAELDKMTLKDFVSMSGLDKLDDATQKLIIEHVQSTVKTAVDNTVQAGSELGASKMKVQNQVDFVSKLMDNIDKGVGALVDADMNAESARLASLQVQQQLGIQALSIANQNSQNILSLFRG